MIGQTSEPHMPRNCFWCLWAIWLISLEPASAVSVVNGTLGDSVYFHQFVYWKAPLEWRFGVFGDDEVVAVRPFYGAPYCYPRYQGRCQLSSEGALQLNNLTYTDQGQYVFIVGAVDPYRSQIVYYQLQIYSPLNVPVLILNASHNRLVSGSNVTFHCDGGNQNITSYIFYRDGKKICFDPHVTCRDSYLYIQPITGSESGRYTCTIHNPVSSNISNVLLVTVSATLTAPALVPNSAPDHLFNGSHASFHCDAGKQHVATYTFYRDGKNICSEPHVTCRGSNLYFQKISKHDSGRYTCTIQNTASTSISNILQLSVSAPTSAAELTSNKTELVWEGETVSFNCSTQLTAAQFTWKVNGSLLPGGDQYILFEDIVGQFTTLTISPVSTNETGSYTCEASNATLNESSNPLSLNVGIAPTNASIYCGSEALTGGVVLTCSWAGGQPAADIELSFDGTTDKAKDVVNRTVLLGTEVQQPVLTCQGNQSMRISVCQRNFAPASAAELTSNAKGWLWEGDTVSLYCSAQLTDAAFIWHVDGDLLPGGDEYHISEDPLGPNTTLTISPVFRKHTGSYTCFAFNATLSETSNALNLSVAKPTNNPSIYCKSEAYTEQMLLGCSWAGGQPSADIKLSFNGTVKEGQDDVNWTVSLDYEVQQPELICQGDQVGKKSECKIVFERPLSSSHNNNAVTSVMEGEKATLIVTLNTPNALHPTFSWFHLNPDPVAITSGGKFQVESGNSQSSLIISDVSQSEKGTYECRARNIIGGTTFKLNLEVKSQESSGSSGLSGGAIAGIVIGVLAGVALIGVGGFFLVKKLL